MLQRRDDGRSRRAGPCNTGSRSGMSDLTLLVLLAIPMVAALALGIWVGLGYPGLYGRTETSGRIPTRSPWEKLVDWIVGKLDG